ncbi:MAG: UDP-N-acetylglucosamine--LPS N-acetylglucosamine transferase [Arenibacterium sp.]
MSNPTRIMAVASAGGHWVQLMRLRPSWAGMDVSYVSTDPGLEALLGTGAGQGIEASFKFYPVVDANRWTKMKLVKQLFQLLRIILATRPHVIITTGAAPGYFALRIGKMMGARTIWVDSIANAEELSLSGQQARKFADLWLTQWQHLERPDGPEYKGSVI